MGHFILCWRMPIGYIRFTRDMALRTFNLGLFDARRSAVHIARPMLRRDVRHRLSVRSSFVYSIETSKHILILSHLLVAHHSGFSTRNIMAKFLTGDPSEFRHVSEFPHKTLWRNSDRTFTGSP